uniref:Uncharacterized protein n=1 Tax=Glossina austeni TaxID=7395 RepID=A0A1A9UNL0_GLOAU
MGAAFRRCGQSWACGRRDVRTIDCCRRENYGEPTTGERRSAPKGTSLANKVNSGNPLTSKENLETPLRSETKQGPHIHRNERPLRNKARRDRNASSQPTISCPQCNQRHQPPNCNRYLVKAELIANHATSHARLTDKPATDVQELTSIASPHPQPGSLDINLLCFPGPLSPRGMGNKVFHNTYDELVNVKKIKKKTFELSDGKCWQERVHMQNKQNNIHK